MNGTLSRQLADLPPETDPGFGTAARALLAGTDASDEALTAVLEDTDQPEQTRFNAFWRRLAPATVGVILVAAGFLMTWWGPTGAGAAVHQPVGQGA